MTAELLPFPGESSRAARYLQVPRSPATLRAYAADWRQWERWCRFQKIDACPASPGALAEHLAWLADEGKSVATIRRRAAGVAFGLRMRKAPAPARDGEVEELLRCIGRVLDPDPPRRAPPVELEDMRAIADCLAALHQEDRHDMASARDRALLLVGWVGALRRSELVGLDWEDLAWRPEGLILTLRRTKQRTAAIEHYIVRSERLARCPLSALGTWKNRSHAFSGPIFRRILRGGAVGSRRLGSASVGPILRARADEAGVKTAGLTAHSLRSGGLTAAAMAGARRAELLRHSRHRRGDTLDGYIRPAQAWERHPARGLL